MYQSKFQSIVSHMYCENEEDTFRVSKPMLMRVLSVEVYKKDGSVVSCEYRNECDSVLIKCGEPAGPSCTIHVNLCDADVR